jgi:hypothetical protein
MEQVDEPDAEIKDQEDEFDKQMEDRLKILVV